MFYNFSWSINSLIIILGDIFILEGVALAMVLGYTSQAIYLILSYKFLKNKGVAAIYGPGTNIPQAAHDIIQLIQKKKNIAA